MVVEFSMMNTWRKVFKISGFFYLVLIRSNPGSFVHIVILRVPPTPTFSVAPEFLVKNQNRSKNGSKIVVVAHKYLFTFRNAYEHKRHSSEQHLMHYKMVFGDDFWILTVTD